MRPSRLTSRDYMASTGAKVRPTVTSRCGAIALKAHLVVAFMPGQPQADGAWAHARNRFGSLCVNLFQWPNVSLHKHYRAIASSIRKIRRTGSSRR